VSITLLSLLYALESQETLLGPSQPSIGGFSHFFSVVVGLMSAQLGLIWAGSNLRKGDGLLIHNGPWAVQNLLFLLFSSLMHTGLWLRRISCKYLAKLMLIGDQIGRHCRPNSEPRHLGPLVPVVADLPGRRGH